MKEQLDWIPLYVSEIQRHSQYLSLENKGRLLDIICFVINADLDLNSDYKTVLKEYNLADDYLLNILDKFSFFKYLQNLIEKQKNKRFKLRENSAKGGKSTKNKHKQKDSQLARQKASLLNSNSNSIFLEDRKGVQGERKIKKTLQKWEEKNGVLSLEKFTNWIKQKNLDERKVSDEIENFKLKCQSKGYEYIDFVSAFQSWVNNDRFGNGIDKFKKSTKEVF